MTDQPPVQAPAPAQPPPQVIYVQAPAAPVTASKAHTALWCSIIGAIIPVLGWLTLSVGGFVGGWAEIRRAKKAGNPTGVAIAATVIGGLFCVPILVGASLFIGISIAAA